jgi:(p)ppGpp synthase/HD superfamily hydrolase
LNQHLLIMSASAFAAESHKYQVRKELNEPYILHPLRVAKMAAMLDLPDTDIAAALLHDVLEDTPTPWTTVANSFPGRTTTLVRALTKWWNGEHPSAVIAANKEAYYRNILATDGAPMLKVLDRIDNLYDFARIARMTPGNHAWASRYLDKTEREFYSIIAFLSLGSKEAEKTAVNWYNNAVKVLEDSL